MKTVRNILTVVAVSAFLFSCEGTDYANEDENLIDVKASEEDGGSDSSDDAHEELENN